MNYRLFMVTNYIGVVIYSNPLYDDPIEFHNNAQLAVKYREKGVCGFGILGAGNYLFFLIFS